MNGVLTVPDAEQFRAFTAGDEDALAAIYRAEYEPLLSIARQRLGDEIAHYAPRMAQQAMLETWRSREKMGTPSDLVTCLQEALADSVRVQHRKHASFSRRQGAVKRTTVIPTADEAVASLLAALHEPPPDHEAMMAEVKAAKKHHAAEHVQKVGKPRNLVGAAILLGSLVVIAGAGLWWMDSRSEDFAVDKALKAEDARNLTSNRGQRGTVTLNDDSKARMGADTRLRMPRAFGSTMRTLELTGAAHFEVAPDKPQPFRVRAGNTVITAAATAFAVRAYEGDTVVLVWVTEGKVDVALREGRAKQTVNAGEAVRVVSSEITPLDENARDVAMSWLRDSLVFVDMPVKAVLPELERWYDLRPQLADPSLGDRRVSLRLALQSSGDALKAMADSARLQIGFDKDDKVVLRDAPPAPAAPARTPARRR
jgi:transmembrane sensor